MADNYNLLSFSEQELITTKLIELINTFPDLPSIIKKNGVQFYDMFPNSECLGIATLGTPKIISRYIGDSYIGGYNFRLDYRYSTKDPKERINKQSFLSTLGDWLAQKPIIKPGNPPTTYRLEKYPEISENITIYTIETSDFTILADKNKSGYEDSINDFILRYHYRKDMIIWQ